jgi:DNA-3-methyladenine glycosylase
MRSAADEPRRVPDEWFARSALDVAPDLIGKLLVVGECSGRIIEVEAYTEDDPASHSFRGRTRRNAVMFGPPGRLYVYFTYGMHHCLNIVTGDEGVGEAVLIRAVTPVTGVELMRSRRRGRPDRELTNGPAKLAQAFDVDLRRDGSSVTVLDDGSPRPTEMRVTPRIGISRGTELLRRWVVPADA